MDEVENQSGTYQDEFVNQLKAFTTARIGIGKTGASIPFKQSLVFKLAHAHARDAVYSELDLDMLSKDIQHLDQQILLLHSQASYREQYLQRPDMGRQLNQESIDALNDYAGYDVVIVIADGLSATAVNRNAVGLLKLLLPQLVALGLKVAPICLVKQGRVAIADDIGFHLRAKISLILIGERPGLSSADSMGAYLTFSPKPGLTDESRNCISNIRPHGLTFKLASHKLFYLIQEALKRKISGVGLKDNAGLLSR
jgi:ethanolamine ammonia-lyase small subunit